MAGRRSQKFDYGSPHTLTQYTFHANWGTLTPATDEIIGADSSDIGGRLSITARATTGANPTVAVAFKDGAFLTTPKVIVSRGDVAAPTTCFWAVTAVSKTGFTATLVGTPTAGNTYILDWIAQD